MNELIEKYAMQCTSWPYWRDMPNDGNIPSALITEWPSHITEEQKAFWRLFITNLINDLKNEVTVINTSKIDQIIELLTNNGN